MSTLILGARGRLGSEFRFLDSQAISLSHHEADLENPKVLSDLFIKIRPTLVINCAAMTQVDEAEVDQRKAFEVNQGGVRLLALLSQRYSSRLIHFSTNYVFDGKSSKSYSERSKPNPLNVYGQSKLLGEQAVLSLCPDSLIIRTSGLYGTLGDGGFASKILSQALEQKFPIRVVADQYLNPTYTRHLAQASLDLAHGEKRGLIHLVSEGCCSWYEFAQELLTQAALVGEIIPVSYQSLAFLAKRPTNGCMRSLREPYLPSIREGIKSFLADYRQNAVRPL